MPNNTYWTESIELKSTYPKLSGDTSTDVVIIGAGITGITTAYLLSKSGKKVILIDKGPIHSGETAYTTAFLTIYPDVDLKKIKERWNEERVKLVLRSQEEAINLIENISKEENIDCEFERTKVYVYTKNTEGVEYLKTESEIANKAGCEFVYKDDNAIVVDNFGYIEIPNQGKFHPLKYLDGLSKVLIGNGVQIFENTQALQIQETDDGVVVETENGKITAKHAVMSTHNTFGGPFFVQNELIQKNTYVVCVEVESPDLSDSLYWDTEDPYNYIRIDKSDNRIVLLIGGADHETGEAVNSPEEKYSRLEEYLKSTIDGINYKVLHKWSGQVIETVDGLPYIGFLPEKKNVLVATGFAGNGMTFGTISARIMTDLINNDENSLTDLYPLTRIKAVRNIFKKGVNIVKQYTKKYAGDFDDLDESSLEPDSGKVYEDDNGNKIAVYKAESGEVTRLSAVCTHLGCIVDWNNDQKSWDCPCHGSRFTKEGEVINGPATKPLDKADPS